MIPHRKVAVLVVACAVAMPATAALPTELRLDGASYRSSGLYRAASGEFFHVEYFPPGQTSQNAAKSVEFFRQPLSTDRLDQLIELHLQNLEHWEPRGELTVVEKSEHCLVLKEVRFDGTLAGRPSFMIYLYELSGRTLLSSQFMFRPLAPFDTPESFSREYTSKAADWLKELRRASGPVQESLRLEADKGRTANRGQPIRSETNRTSSAAGPGR